MKEIMKEEICKRCCKEAGTSCLQHPINGKKPCPLKHLETYKKGLRKRLAAIFIESQDDEMLTGTNYSQGPYLKVRLSIYTDQWVNRSTGPIPPWCPHTYEHNGWIRC